MAHHIDVTDAEFQAKVIDSDVPVVVDFWAPWCGPCRAIAPHLESLAEQYAGQLVVAKVNVDQNQRVAGQLGVRGIPALKVFKGGKMVDQMTGMPGNPKAALEKLVSRHI